MLTRRTTLAALTAPLWAGCERAARPLTGGWLGANDERGHWLRDAAGPLARKSGALPAPAVQRRTEVLVVGGGVAGLGCLRALSRAGVSGAALLELEDRPGGNSRGHQIAGMRCPLGAHYLPVPGDEAHEVIELLEDLGLLRIEHGRRVYDERHLCHSPQERLYVGGAWHEGLVPPAQVGSPSYAAYRRFAHLVAEARRQLGFAIPSARAPWRAEHQALDAITFAEWLNRQGLHDAALRNYLDYCCRDDYGAGIEAVSAWAGLHYFASRHGFHAPGDGEVEPEPVLTWPEGNAWLTERMASPLAERVHAGRIVWRVEPGRHGVQVDAWNAAAAQAERWHAEHVVLATPLFVSARLWVNAPTALTEAAVQVLHAPWLVANLQLDAPLLDRPGFPPAWDNVVHGSAWLGYVDAMHQSTRPPHRAHALSCARGRQRRCLPCRAPGGVVAWLASRRGRGGGSARGATPRPRAKAAARRPHALRARDAHSDTGVALSPCAASAQPCCGRRARQRTRAPGAQRPFDILDLRRSAFSRHARRPFGSGQKASAGLIARHCENCTTARKPAPFLASHAALQQFG
jgi:protoporphyrinogen oxidase